MTVSQIIWCFVASAATTAAASCWRDAACTGPTEAAFPGPWESSIYSPASRLVQPRDVMTLSGDISSAYDPDAAIVLDSGANSDVVLDFGIEVGGIVTVNYTLSGGPATLGLAFTESKQWIGRESDSSNGNTGPDLALLSNLTAEGEGSYVMPDVKLRGGFRYLTIFLDSQANATLELNDITLEIGFQPTWSNLRAYQGYFHSNDELLNRIWYSGAYTLQTNAAPPNTCRRDPLSVRSSWYNDVECGPGDTILLEGAKRDRWVWIGDMGVAVPTAFLSIGDGESTKNALQTIYDNQKENGMLPKAGPPHTIANSDTYHMWTLIGTYIYFLYTQDMEFLTRNWDGYVRAVDYIAGNIGCKGILNVTGINDWGRWTYGTEASSANMMLYRSLITGATLASWVPELSETNLTAEYLAKAEALRESIVAHLWDEDKGAFIDSTNTTDLYPQDANSMAVAFELVDPKSEMAQRITDYLVSNWTPIGPSSPELDNNVSPFISSIELEAHFKSGRPDRALELMRTSWGWYINNTNGTESTVIEGYLVDGTFGYRGERGYRNDPSYVSHAHGWSSGPTSTLTEYMVGLRITKPLGEEWTLSPASFDLLPEAEAGFTTALGKFSAKFTVTDDLVVIEWSAPENTIGTLAIPGRDPQEVGGGQGRLEVAL